MFQIKLQILRTFAMFCLYYEPFPKKISTYKVEFIFANSRISKTSSTEICGMGKCQCNRNRIMLEEMCWGTMK